MSKSSSRMKKGFPFIPPCQAACPIHQDVREYLRLIAAGEFSRSLEVIRKTNPLASVCGTICAHQCEEECRRHNIDEPLSIRGLKRAAVEYGEVSYHVPPANPLKRVAVIGSGPAGLTAAFDLVMQGCKVTVFERELLVGGAPRNFIPFYRLPDETIDRDIDALQKLGIEFKTGLEFGTDFNVENLKKDGFKAVIIAVGLSASLKLPIPGADHRDVLTALQFLKASKREAFRLEGQEVIVIGGGNVAIDVARSAVRCGAVRVRLVCLETEEEMPAFPWEIKEAREEGVEFNYSWGPVGIRIRDGKIAGLDVHECISVFDEQKTFNPCFNEQRRGFLSGDTVIVSIGQVCDTEAVRMAGVPADARGQLDFDPATMKTSAEGVFACGEIVTGPGTAVKAMANGRLAAMAVAAYLEEKPSSSITSDTGDFLPLPDLEADVAAKVKKIPRQKIPVLTAQERCDSFLPMEKGYTMAMAVQESLRCLGCAAGARQIVEKCVNCLTCLRTCPYNVPAIGETGELMIREHQCQVCGLCLTVCPNLAIEFRTPYFAEAEKKLKQEVKAIKLSANGAPAILVLSCGLGAFALPEFNEGFIKNKPENVGVVKFPCISKIDTTHILEAFKLGVDSVITVGCQEDNDCPFKKTMYWAGQRAKRVKYLLGEAGIDEERFVLVGFSREKVACFGDAISEVLSKMQELGKR